MKFCIARTHKRDRRSAASLRSSIYEHVEENGRTYHAYNSGSECQLEDCKYLLMIIEYMMPNDEIEQERLGK